MVHITILFQAHIKKNYHNRYENVNITKTTHKKVRI